MFEKLDNINQFDWWMGGFEPMTFWSGSSDAMLVNQCFPKA